jgi:hypothetical protein
MRLAVGGLLCCGLWCAASSVWAQGTLVGGIYTCVDAQGRRLTSDRPIPECTDREQRVLNSSGTLKQKVGPSLTASERAQQEARDKQTLEERNHRDEQRRQTKALLTRYPSQLVHDQARAAALAQIASVTQAANLRLVELAAQRQKLDDELEFYRKDPSKAPLYLRRQAEENHQNAEAQRQFIVDQEEEKKRVNTRFDSELVLLRQLWHSAAP